MLLHVSVVQNEINAFLKVLSSNDKHIKVIDCSIRVSQLLAVQFSVSPYS